jgi:hypothetical protein
MATFKDIKAIENGARFVNVDLHIHSYGASTDVTDAGMTPKAIIDSAIRQGLSVIAITDHNSDANVAEAVAYAKEFDGKILVVPGVEVTSAHGHLLAYFSPERLNDLSSFLAKIDLVGAKGAENTHTAKSMADVIGVAYQLDGVCIAAHIDLDRTGFEKFAPGFQNWKRDILRSPGLFGLECNAIDALEWYSEDDIGSSAATVRREIFMSRMNVQELKGRHHLAHLQGSDSHNLHQFEGVAPSKPWSRMKLTDLTWESFCTALTDPTARVKPKATLPKAISRVVGISLTGGFLNQEMIQFSDNLNCFIGGRGTGKSTAIRALAYAFGLNDEFEEFDNCPDLVEVFCESGDGTLFRYERSRSGDISVKAKADGSVCDVPVDSFAIEYLGQGDLADIARDPMNSPGRFQSFLDRYTTLRDLLEEEAGLISQLRENGASLLALESSFGQLKQKKLSHGEIEKKLQIAEEGKLKEIVGQQSKISSERTVKEAIEAVVDDYDEGIDLSEFERELDVFIESAGEVTTDPASVAAFTEVRKSFDKAKLLLVQKGKEVNEGLKEIARDLEVQCKSLKENHVRMGGILAPKIADLKAKGLAGNISEIEKLIREKSVLAGQIAAVEKRRPELLATRRVRNELRDKLARVRAEMTKRRKGQLAYINKMLGSTLQDYLVFVKYDDAGIIDEFLEFLQTTMSGSHFQEKTARLMCSKITPDELANLIYDNNAYAISDKSGVSTEWAEEIIQKMRKWKTIFDLQEIGKPAKPVITVRTKGEYPREIPVIQLSDGQRHTILLTIAMLSESRMPLIIDQPEDDLDNAFIAATIVATLRAVKEKRQIIVVTHNANIAVLGDAELILPMQREHDCGKVIERGSIDRVQTKDWVQRILEGGANAFDRRHAIYGH